MVSDNQLSPEKWELLKLMTMDTAQSMYPQASTEEIKTYVDELFKFEKFLMEKYDKSLSEVGNMLIDFIKTSLEESAKIHKQLEEELERVSNGEKPSRDFSSYKIEITSTCMKKMAVLHEYPYADDLEEGYKILDEYIREEIKE